MTRIVMSALHVSEWYKLRKQCPRRKLRHKYAVTDGGITTGMSVSAELLLLRLVGEVVFWVDCLMEESYAVQVVIHCWGSEIP